MNTSNAIADRAAEALRAAIAGDVFVPGDRGYDQARRAWNLATDQRPAAVVFAESATDVARAVRFARARGMRIAPQGTGLLMAPQGLGAVLTISLAGYLTDKVGARRVVPVGVLLALAGTAWFTQIGVHTPYWALLMALFLVGAGMGATITPAMAAAY